jgi:Mn2+/Fe2+ NRAMP family transporter
VTDAERLAELDQRPFLPRTLGYLKLMGPGYMQSAMTLGGGTAFASIFAGAAFGYELLWVAPLSMLLGVVVLAAIAHQTLSTGANPFQAMKRHAGPFFAYSWALSGILSSIIWQFAQYALAAAMLGTIAKSAGVEAPPWVWGLAALVWCVSVAMLYESKPRLIHTYENILKGMVWFILLCFLVVVVRTGIPEPSALLRGLVPFRVPADWAPTPGVSPVGAESVSSLTVIVAGLAAAVGANMVFVYPYTLVKKGWGRAHRRLARVDLGFGMFVPFAIAASLMLIASASIFHYQLPGEFAGRNIHPRAVAEILAAPDRLGPVAGLWIFGLGIVAMALSSITMQMLCSGFALCEMLGRPSEGATYRVGMLLPAVGVLGSVFWGDLLWIALPTTVICGFLLPLVYVAFIKMQLSEAYLGADRPRGAGGRLWIAGMVLATALLTVFLGWKLVGDLPRWIETYLWS